MNKRIVSILCCLPLLTGGIIDKPIDISNLHNNFKRLIIQDNTYPLQDDKSRFKRFEVKAKEAKNLRMKQIIKERNEYIKQFKLKEEVEKRKKRQEEISHRGLSGQVKEVEFILSYFTDLPEENGGYTVTCTGKPLIYGVVASNVYSLGTKVYLKGYGTFTVADRGGNHFNNPNRLDVLIPKNKNESNSHYKRRVNDMGKSIIKGYVEIK